MISDESFYEYCSTNRDLRIERDAEKNISVREPFDFYTGIFNSDIITELGLWNRSSKLGTVLDSSTGFTLPDGAVFSPGAAWVSNEKTITLSEEDKERFAPVCPNFIIELKSKSDHLPHLKNKMQKWIENGCELAWLIIPENQEAHIYRSNGSIEIIQDFDHTLSGGNVLPEFIFDLKILSK